MKIKTRSCRKISAQFVCICCAETKPALNQKQFLFEPMILYFLRIVFQLLLSRPDNLLWCTHSNTTCTITSLVSEQLCHPHTSLHFCICKYPTVNKLKTGVCFVSSVTNSSADLSPGIDHARSFHIPSRLAVSVHPARSLRTLTHL